MVQSDLHDPLDAQPVDVPHAEVLDAEVLQNQAAAQIRLFLCGSGTENLDQEMMDSLLSGVDVPQSHVHQVPRGQEGLGPREPGNLRHLEETRERHPEAERTPAGPPASSPYLSAL